MASDETTTSRSSVHSSTQDLDDVDGYLVHDYTDDDDARRHHMYDDDNEEEEEEGRQEGNDVHMGIQMSRLSLETWEGDGDANTHVSDPDVGGASSGCDVDDDGRVVIWGSSDYLSLPGTPTRCSPRRRAVSTKEYASESEADRARLGGRALKKSIGAASYRSSSTYSHYSYRGPGRTRERRLDRAWEMKRCQRAWAGGPDSHSGGSSPCVVVRPSGPGAGGMWMDMEEVKACRDLGLELPCDWSVEIPPGALTAVAAADPGSVGDSLGNWRTSSPGDDTAGDLKARLRVWAQAVALASASHPSS